ncbi:MAG: tRNA pseudouridine(13) synthase TruD [Phycisphaerae bacterium]|nr:tRNA pseudouridine(13) synthase TruD [Phycisphaerae bacterium]
MTFPYLTEGLPGVGGVVKQSEDDFVVEELPLYEPSGNGTHTYFGIEKRGLTTLAAVELIAKALGKRPRDIGYAGLKDARAVTRQMLSVEHVAPQRVEALDLSRIKVLWVNQHRNKLKLGHLKGNRFILKIREVAPDAAARAGEIIAMISRCGVPNYFGPQRFGARGDNAAIGHAVLKGDFDEAIGVLLGRPGLLDRDEVLRARELFDQGCYEEAGEMWPAAFREQIRLCRAMAKSGGNAERTWSAVNHSLRRLYLSAEQSRLFNVVVETRIRELGRLQQGDLAWKHVNGACFRVEDAVAEQPRCDTFEISPTGPLFGTRMTEPAGQPGELEAKLLADAGLDRTLFRSKHGVKLDGARRPLRVPLDNPEVVEAGDQQGSHLRLTFALPPGSYATMITREVCKTDNPDDSPP